MAYLKAKEEVLEQVDLFLQNCCNSQSNKKENRPKTGLTVDGKGSEVGWPFN